MYPLCHTLFKILNTFAMWRNFTIHKRNHVMPDFHAVCYSFTTLHKERTLSCEFFPVGRRIEKENYIETIVCMPLL